MTGRKRGRGRGRGGFAAQFREPQQNPFQNDHMRNPNQFHFSRYGPPDNNPNFR